MPRPNIDAAIVVLRSGALLPWSGGPCPPVIQVAGGPLLRGHVVEVTVAPAKKQHLLVYAVDRTEVDRTLAALSRPR